MANKHRGPKKHARILLHLGRFFLILALLSCILGPWITRKLEDLYDDIQIHRYDLLPDEQEYEPISPESHSIDNQSMVPEETRIPKWGLYSITFAFIGSIFLMLYFIINKLKKNNSENKKEQSDVMASGPKNFDPSGLYSTTTPLTPGSQYGSKDEVSVTSPLNNGYYFQIVEELKFLGSDEIIQ